MRTDSYRRKPKPTDEAVQAAQHPISSGAANPTASYDEQGRLIAPPGMAAPGETEAPAPDTAPTASDDQPKEMAATVASGVKEGHMATVFRLRDHIAHSHLGYYISHGAVIFGASFFVWLFTKIRLGVAGMVIVGMFVIAAYNRALERVMVRYKDDQERIIIRKKALEGVTDGDGEKMMWLNNFLARFWPIYMPALSAQVIQIADGILVQNCPSFLDAIRLTQFTLGSKAPQITYVRTFPHTEEDVIMTEWKFNYTPEDTSDMTVKQAKSKIDPKVELSVRIGAGLAGATLPILVQNMQFSGTLRVQFKLISNFPNIQTVGISFMEPPKFDYVLKPVGGSKLGFDVGNIPGLNEFIQGQVHANLGPMMYSPNVFTVNLEELLAGNLFDTAIGVLQVSVYSAKDVQGVKFGGGTPDPYVSLTLNDKPDVLEKTSVKQSNSNPNWRETKFVLINSLAGLLTLNVLDYNDVRADNPLGTTTFDLAELAQNPEQDGLSDPIILNGKPRGTLQYGISYFPLLKPEKSADGAELPLPETRTGVLALTVHSAKNLGNKSLNSKARVLLNGKPVNVSNVFKKSDAPNWEFQLPLLVTQREKAVVGIQIVDDGDKPIGQLAVKLDDMLEAASHGQDWYPLASPSGGATRARVSVSSVWKPVRMAGGVNSGSGYSPSIGALRITLGRGAGLPGKPLPFVELRNKGLLADRSKVLLQTAEPDFKGQVLYAPIHSLRERVMVELMDYQPNGKHRFLGKYELQVSNFAREESENAHKSQTDPWPYRSTGKQVLNAAVSLGGKSSGKLQLEVEFLPAVHLRDAVFDNGEPAAVEKAKELETAPSSGSTPPEALPDSAAITSSGAAESSKALPAVPSKAETEAAPAQEGDAKDNPASEVEQEEEKPGGIILSPEQLTKQPRGILAINLLEGKLSVKQARVEVLVDNGYWPTYLTTASRGAINNFDEVCEAVIKDLDTSVVTIRVRTRGDGNDTNLSDVVASGTFPARDFLAATLTDKSVLTLTPNPTFNPATIPGFGDMSEGAQEAARNAAAAATKNLPGLGAVSSGVSSGLGGLSKIGSGALGTAGKGLSAVTSGVSGVASGVTGAIGGVTGLQIPLGAAGGPCTIQVQSRWIPVPFTPSPSESILNQGQLVIEALHAENLRGADRGGKSSDPFAALVVGDERIAQTKTIKKTLKPTWNETLGTVPLLDRSAPGVRIELRDWDQLGAGDALGGFDLPDLTALEPDEAREETFPVVGEHAGDGHPVCTLRLTYHPEWVQNGRQGITAAATGIAAGLGKPAGAVTGAMGGVVGGVGHGVGAVGGAVGGLGKSVISTPKNLFGHKKHESASGADASVADAVNTTADATAADDSRSIFSKRGSHKLGSLFHKKHK